VSVILAKGSSGRWVGDVKFADIEAGLSRIGEDNETILQPIRLWIRRERNSLKQILRNSLREDVHVKDRHEK